MAVANYHDTYGAYPPAYVADRDGKPMHSWRVLLLPFLEQQNLYAQYRFDEPWNGPNNAKLAGEIPYVYIRPGLSKRTTTTSFVAVVGPETAWPGTRTIRREDIKDGPSQTVLLVEVADSGIPWMAPRDLRFDRMSFRINDPSGKGIGSTFGGARVLFADGTVRQLPDSFDPGTLKALLTVRGGEQFEPPANW